MRASLTGPANGPFAYDGFGRRRSKTVSGTTTQFLDDGLNPVQELSGGTPTANLLTGLGIDEFYTRTDGAGVRNYLMDALGSSVALADGTGAVLTDYTYEPFGATATIGASSDSTFQFTGRETDGTGLHHYRARYYNPATHRFVSEDPIGFGGGWNAHAYGENDPVTLKRSSRPLPRVSCGGRSQSGGCSDGGRSRNGCGGRSYSSGCRNR